MSLDERLGRSLGLKPASFWIEAIDVKVAVDLVYAKERHANRIIDHRLAAKATISAS